MRTDKERIQDLQDEIEELYLRISGKRQERDLLIERVSERED